MIMFWSRSLCGWCERYVEQCLILHVDAEVRFIEAFLKPPPELHGTWCPAPFAMLKPVM